MSDLKQRAAEATLIAFNSNLKRNGGALHGGLRDDCLQAAHERVQKALGRFTGRKAELSTFVARQVDGAIKDELREQRAGMIGTPRGANLAPVSLDTPSAPRYAFNDLSAPRWHLVGEDHGRAADLEADNATPTEPAPDSDATFNAPLGEARSDEDRSRKSSHEDGEDRPDKLAVSLIKHVEPDEQTGPARDRAEAPAAWRHYRDEQWRLYWNQLGERALASELFAPGERAVIATMGSDYFFETVRRLQRRYPDTADELIAEAALFEGITEGMAELEDFARIELERTKQRAAQDAERLRKAVHSISELWFPYAGMRKRQGLIRKWRASLHEVFSAQQWPLDLVVKVAKALPGVLRSRDRPGPHT